MAFKQYRMEKVSSFGGTSKEVPELSNWFYRSADDNIAAVMTANYFDPMVGKGIAVGDIIAAFTTSGPIQLRVNAISAAGHVTVNKIGHAHGQQVTASAADTVVTGLSNVVMAVACMDSDPTDDPEWVTCTIGDQAGAPAAGSIIIKTWKNTAGNDPTPLAATTFAKKVNWIAFGS